MYTNVQEIFPIWLCAIRMRFRYSSAAQRFNSIVWRLRHVNGVGQCNRHDIYKKCALFLLNDESGLVFQSWGKASFYYSSFQLALEHHKGCCSKSFSLSFFYTWAADTSATTDKENFPMASLIIQTYKASLAQLQHEWRSRAAG